MISLLAFQKNYTPVPHPKTTDFENYDHDHPFLDHDPSSYSDQRENLVYSRRHKLFTCFSLCLNVVLLLFFIFRFRLPLSSHSSMKELLRATSEYSPLLEELDIHLSTTRMNGTFMNTYPPSIYRQAPSPEVDAAWLRIASTKPIVVATEEVEKMGYDSSTTARYPPEFELGPDAHIGRLDVFHLIHCLDALRKEANFDYYYGEKFPNRKPSELHTTHTTHCTYILLQNIMCNANADIYMHYWIDTQDIPFPDFSINHKCRNFDALLGWQEENSLELEYYWQTLKKPDDAVERVMSPEYKVLFEVEP